MLCHSCEQEVPENNYKCPHCGNILKGLDVSDFAPKKKRKIDIPVHTVVIVGLLALAAIIIGTFFMRKVSHTMDNAMRDILGSSRGTDSGTAADSGGAGPEELQRDEAGTGYRNPLRKKRGNEFADFSYTPGMRVDLKQWESAGGITIFHFYSDHHPPCGQMSARLEALDAQNADVSLVHINTNREGVGGIDWDAPVMKQYNIRSLPFIVVRQNDKCKSFAGEAAFNKVYLLRYGGDDI